MIDPLTHRVCATQCEKTLTRGFAVAPISKGYNRVLRDDLELECTVSCTSARSARVPKILHECYKSSQMNVLYLAYQPGSEDGSVGSKQFEKY